MKFVLFVEGYTERKVIADFLKRWLDPKLSKSVGISTVRFDGWQELVKDSPKKARLHLEQPKVIAVISLLDLYGPTFFPSSVIDVEERYKWGKEHLEKQVGQEMFFHFFAVHEIEAWLLSNPSIFTGGVREAVEPISHSPESIDDTRPPSIRLNEIYNQSTKKNYKKVVFGEALFKKLDPELAYKKCPHLKLLLDKMLELAKDSED